MLEYQTDVGDREEEMREIERLVQAVAEPGNGERDEAGEHG